MYTTRSRHEELKLVYSIQGPTGFSRDNRTLGTKAVVNGSSASARVFMSGFYKLSFGGGEGEELLDSPNRCDLASFVQVFLTSIPMWWLYHG